MGVRTVNSGDSAPSASAVGPGLRVGSVTLAGVAAEALGAVGPETSATFLILPAAVLAGPATPGALLVAGAGATAVAATLARLSRRHADAGGLSTLVGRTLGPVWGIASGVALSVFLIASVAAGAAVGTIATALYRQYSPRSHNLLTTDWWPWAIVTTAAALLLAYLGIRPAVRVLLFLSGLGVGLFVVLSVAVLLRGGIRGDVWSSMVPVSHGVSVHAFVVGSALGVLPYTGFEAATFLGSEAVNPRRDIPLVTVGVVAGSAVFYVLVSLAMVSAFGASAQGQHQYVSVGFASVLVAGNHYVAPWFGTAALWVVLAAAFTGMVAVANEAARLLFQWGRDGVLPRVFTSTSTRFRSPTVALLVLAGAAAIVYAVVFGLAGGSTANTVHVATYVSLMVSASVLVCYACVGVAGLIEVRRERYVAPQRALLPLVALIVIGAAVYNQLVPVPASPYQSAPYIGVGILLLGACVARYQTRRLTALPWRQVRPGPWSNPTRHRVRPGGAGAKWLTLGRATGPLSSSRCPRSRGGSSAASAS